MTIYKVTLGKSLTFYQEVEADNEEQALDIAVENAPSLCAHCTGYSDEWSVDESDWEEESVESDED